MKKCTAVLLLTLVALFWAPQTPAMAFTYDGAWLPSDDDALLFNASGSFALYLFDWETAHVPDVNQDLAVIDTLDGSQTLTILDFYLDGGTCFVGDRFTGKALDLKDSFEFGLYFYAESTAYAAYEVTGFPDLWDLSTDSSPRYQVSLFDADPVPLPGAVWLLGPGVLGLIGWRVRRVSREGA